MSPYGGRSAAALHWWLVWLLCNIGGPGPGGTRPRGYQRASVAAEVLPALDAAELACSGLWAEVQKRLGTLVVGIETDRAVVSQVARAAAVQTEGEEQRCPLGMASLRVASLLHGGPNALEAAGALERDWQLLHSIGWPATVRSGWPVFQLFRLLHIGLPARTAHAGRKEETRCDSPVDPFSTLLWQSLAHKLPDTGSSLVVASLAYLADSGPVTCPLAVAAALAAIAWSRLPIYDDETEALLQQAQQHAHQVPLEVVLAGEHPVLGVLAWVSAAYQLSGSPAKEEEAQPDDDDAGVGDCIVPFARTPRGRCNAFAPIDRDLVVWRRSGIHLEDVVRAFRPVADQKMILFRLIGDELMLVTPQHSHLDAEFGATEPTCLAQALLDVLERTHLPDFDMVLSHGDLPTLRKAAGRPPFYGPMDREWRVPAPLFSICSSADFWDILFPNVCRPALVNMSHMSPVPWERKRKAALWRGTDRGAANWALEVHDMYLGSPRKRLLDAWGEDRQHFNVAFLDDDLLNVSVVNTDPNFVPLDKWPEWRYLLDLPGNGYSGSLKQKLTSSSLVLLATAIVPGATPVYEHYHAGLQDRRHVLQVTATSASAAIEWANKYPVTARHIVRQAQEYMEQFHDIATCYIWRLLQQYAQLLHYVPRQEQLAAFGHGLTVQSLQLPRRPSSAEAALFERQCLEMMHRFAQ